MARIASRQSPLQGQVSRIFRDKERLCVTGRPTTIAGPGVRTWVERQLPHGFRSRVCRARPAGRRTRILRWRDRRWAICTCARSTASMSISGLFSQVPRGSRAPLRSDPTVSALPGPRHLREPEPLRRGGLGRGVLWFFQHRIFLHHFFRRGRNACGLWPLRRRRAGRRCCVAIGQAQAMDLADHSVSRNATQLFSDLRSGLTLRPHCL